MATRAWNGDALVVARRRHPVEDQLEQRMHVGTRLVLRERGQAVAGDRVDDREVDLRLVGVEVEEQLVDLVHHLGGAGVGPVDLVHDQDHRQPRGQRLSQHEPGLWQRPLAGVDQQQHAVDHRQAALDLAAEVGVPGSVDDVDLRAVVAAGRVLGQDRDAALALEPGVHDPVDHLGVRREGAGLLQQRVHERGLAVVDVGDDRDVSDVIAELVCVRAHRWSVDG